MRLAAVLDSADAIEVDGLFIRYFDYDDGCLCAKYEDGEQILDIEVSPEAIEDALFNQQSGAWSVKVEDIAKVDPDCPVREVELRAYRIENIVKN